MSRRQRTRRRLVGLAGVLSLTAACSVILDLPDPTLDTAIGADANGPGPGVDGGAVETSLGGDSGVTPIDGATDATPTTCNADVKTDPSHCGACFHDCTGGLCKDGLCTLTANVLPNSTHLYGANSVTVAGSHVYFTIGGYLSGVYSCPREGCVATGPKRLNEDVDADNSTPQSLEVYEGFVYWTEYYDNGGAYRTPIAGGPSERISKGDLFEYSTDIAVGPGGIFWTNRAYDQAVASCPLTLCSAAATRLPIAPGNASNGNSEGIVIAPDNSIIWAENTTIVRCADATCNGGIKVVTDTQGPNIYGMAIDNGTLYWGSSFYDEIRSCALSGCGGVSTTLLTNQSGGYISSLAARDGKVYWTLVGTDPDDGGNTTDGIVRRCEAANCAATVTDIAVGQASPSGVAVDDKSVYWSNGGIVDNSGGPSSIMKAPR